MSCGADHPATVWGVAFTVAEKCAIAKAWSDAGVLELGVGIPTMGLSSRLMV